eukprot:m51a1_g4419 putative cystathionine beta-lyase (383) ;mRNA; r:12836-14113
MAEGNPQWTALGTVCVAGDRVPDELYAELADEPDLAPPLHVSSTFVSGSPMVYARSDQPTRHRLEKLLGSILGGRAVAFASGLAAVTCLLQTLRPPRVVVAGVGYRATRDAVAALQRLTACEVLWEAAARSEPLRKGDLVLAESPRNPTCELVDVAELAGRAHEAGAVLAVDSTLASPLLQRALALGADYELHSCTKFLGGHHDTLGGCVACRDPARASQVLGQRTHTGGVMGSLESWLLMRSLRTLGVRMRQQCTTARALALWLAGHAAVAVVHSPCVEGHASHELWKRTVGEEMAPACFSFETRVEAHAEKLAAKPGLLRLWVPCTSLGGVESTIDWRHRFDPEVSPALVRVSVGLEDLTDLISDLEQAFYRLQHESSQS